MNGIGMEIEENEDVDEVVVEEEVGVVEEEDEAEGEEDDFEMRIIYHDQIMRVTNNNNVWMIEKVTKNVLINKTPHHR
jgi:hypothetical protein